MNIFKIKNNPFQFYNISYAHNLYNSKNFSEGYFLSKEGDSNYEWKNRVGDGDLAYLHFSVSALYAVGRDEYSTQLFQGNFWVESNCETAESPIDAMVFSI